MATLDQIVAQLLAAGHPPLPDGHPVVDDQHHRYGKGKKHWYVLHGVERDGQVVGYTGAYGEWSGDENGALSFVWEGTQLKAEDVAAAKKRQVEVAQIEAKQRALAARTRRIAHADSGNGPLVRASRRTWTRSKSRRSRCGSIVTARC